MSIININCCPVATQKPLSSVTPTPTITRTPTPTITPTITPTPTRGCSSAINTACAPIETSLVYSDGATLKRVSTQFVTAGQSLNFSVRGCVSCTIGSCVSNARGIYNIDTFVNNYNAAFAVISTTNASSIPFTTINAFFIGTGASIIAPSSGYVYCGIWDTETWFDNVGNFCVYLDISG